MLNIERCVVWRVFIRCDHPSFVVRRGFHYDICSSLLLWFSLSSDFFCVVSLTCLS
jgi:hypothetical protein